RDRAAAVMRGLGFADPDLDRVLDTFSGGELTRASLARALGGDPDLLLLDEPTNHLDVNSLEWLERELQSLDAGIIIVAHDRWFLEAVTTAVLELEAGRSTFFAGPWHDWRREKAARLQAASRSAPARFSTTWALRSSAASTWDSSGRTGPERRRCSRPCWARAPRQPGASDSATASSRRTSRNRRSSWTSAAASSSACRR